MRGRKAKLRGTRSGRSKAATTAPIWWETGRRDIRCLIRAPAPWPAIACPPREAPTSEGEGRKLCPRWGRKPPRFQCCSERERHPSPCSRPHQAQKCLWVGPGEWAHRSAGVPGRVTETRVSANARGDAGKPGSQAGPRGHEATTVRVMESRQLGGWPTSSAERASTGLFRKARGCVLDLGRGHTPVLSPKANLCSYFTTSHGVLWAR